MRFLSQPAQISPYDVRANSLPMSELTPLREKHLVAVNKEEQLFQWRARRSGTPLGWKEVGKADAARILTKSRPTRDYAFREKMEEVGQKPY